MKKAHVVNAAAGPKRRGRPCVRCCHILQLIKMVVCRFNAQRILSRDCCQNWLRQPPGPSPRARGIASKVCMCHGKQADCSAAAESAVHAHANAHVLWALWGHSCAAVWGLFWAESWRGNAGMSSDHFLDDKGHPCPRRVTPTNEGYCHAARGKGSPGSRPMVGQHGSCDPAWYSAEVVWSGQCE